MFTHIFSYRLKCLLRDRITIFWTMVFPLLLATFFQLAFSNLTTGEKFQPVNIAVVDNESWRKNESFRNVLNDVSTGEDRLFNMQVASTDEAEKLLSDYKISGYILVGETIKLVVNKSGINQSIAKSFIDNYMQYYSAFDRILSKKPEMLKQLINLISKRQTFVNQTAFPGGKPDYVLNYFYSLIAMSCFYGGFLGMREINDIQANISYVAARVNVAPVHKMKAFLSSSAASLLIQYCEMLILLAYMTLVLGVSFGNRFGYVLITTLIGSVAGLSYGAFISTLAKKSEGAKVGILIITTMVCSFLSGMMQQNVKYIVRQKAPLLSWINPLNLLTDSFYCLYYYDTMSRYTLNILLIIAFCLLVSTITYFILRRRKYASI